MSKVRMPEPNYKRYLRRTYLESILFGLLCIATPLLFAWQFGVQFYVLLVGGLLLALLNAVAWKDGMSVSNEQFIADEIPLLRLLLRGGGGNVAGGIFLATPWSYSKTIEHLSGNTEIWDSLLVENRKMKIPDLEDPGARETFVRGEVQLLADRYRNQRALAFCAKATIYSMAIIALLPFLSDS